MTTGPIYTMEEVAAQLRVSRRMLQDIVKEHPLYFSVGNRKRFTGEDVAARIAALRPAPMDNNILKRSQRERTQHFQSSDELTLDKALELVREATHKRAHRPRR